MKSVVMVASMLIGINLYATEKAECEELFRSAIHNFYLENSCKLKTHLSSDFRKKFEDKNCPKLFNDADLKSLNSEVLGSSYQEMNRIGRDKFCGIYLTR